MSGVHLFLADVFLAEEVKSGVAEGGLSPAVGSFGVLICSWLSVSVNIVKNSLVLTSSLNFPNDPFVHLSIASNFYLDSSVFIFRHALGKVITFRKYLEYNIITETSLEENTI